MGRVLLLLLWLVACQAASARTFVLCQDRCCTDDFCGPSQSKKLCRLEASMCGLSMTSETVDVVSVPKSYQNAAVVVETESLVRPPSTPLIYFLSDQRPLESLSESPPVPPPQGRS